MNRQPLPQHGLTLLIGTRACHPIILTLIHQLALRHPLTVVDGLRGFDAFAIARALRRETVELDATLNRIHVSRAGTAYQLVTIVRQIPMCQPLIIHNMLAPFCDQSLRLETAHQLLGDFLTVVQTKSNTFPIICSIKPPPHTHAGLLKRLQAVAHNSLSPYAPQPNYQPALL